MPDLKVAVQITDERTITIPSQCSPSEAKTAGQLILDSATVGYGIKSITGITRSAGDQRDPYTITLGVKIVLAKP